MRQAYETQFEVEDGLEAVRGAKKHRVIEDIPYVPRPSQVYKTIMQSPGWPYKDDESRAHFLKRDRAFVALIYVGCLRASEACTFKNYRTGEERLTLMRSQLKFDAESGAWVLEGVKLVKAKTTRKGVAIPRKHTHREKVYLPMEGERKVFTDLILEWAAEVGDDEPIFRFKRSRAWQIVRALTGQWCHYFRMLGENYLYRAWGKDVMGLAEYLQVHPRTLMGYLKGTWADKPKV